MLLPRALRDSLFHFRKRKQRSLDSILGTERTGPIIHSDPMFDQSMVAGGYDPHQELYMFDFPVEYVADPGPMEIPTVDYHPYAPEQRPSLQGNREIIRGFTLAALGLVRPDETVTYEDGLMDKDFFTQQMEIFVQREPDPMLMESSMEASQVFDHHEINPDISRDQIQEILEFQRAANAQLTVIDPMVPNIPLAPLDGIGPTDNMIPQPANDEPSYLMVPEEFYPQQISQENIVVPETMTYQPMETYSVSEEMPLFPDYFEQQMQVFDRQFQEPQHLENCDLMDVLFQRQEALFDTQQTEVFNLEHAISNELMQPANHMYESDLPMHHNNELPMETLLNQQEMLSEPLAHFSPLEQKVFDEPMEQMNPMPEPMPQNLDYGMQPYENPSMAPEPPVYDNSVMAQEEFDQMMHEAADQMEPQEPMTGPDPYDNNMMPQEMHDPQQMYDPQMQEMMDPYMMSGPPGP